MQKYFVQPIYFIVVGFLFTFFQITGFRLSQNGSMEWSGLITALTLMFSGVGGVLVGNILYRLSAFLGKIFTKKKDWTEQSLHSKRGLYSLLISFLFIMFCWMPIFLAYFPAICAYDFHHQATQFLTGNYSEHHPLLHTILLREFWDFGHFAFGEATYGIALYAMMQMIVLALAFLYGLAILRKNGCNKWLCRGFTIVVALYPLNWFISISTTKDSLFSAFFFIFIVSLAEFIHEYRVKRPTWTTQIVLYTAACGVMIFRNNGKYAIGILAVGIMFSILVNILKRKKSNQYIQLFAWLVVAIGLSIAFMNGAAKSLDSQEGRTREMLSVPMQQMARVYCGYKDELTAEQREYLLAFIEEDKMLSYDPHLADCVKDGVNEGVMMGNIPQFCKIYLQLLQKYPGEFVDAYLELIAGYVYLWDESCARVNMSTGMIGYGYIQTGENQVFLESIDIYKRSQLPGLHQWLQKAVTENIHLKIPVLRQLISPGIWFYLVLSMVAYILTNKCYQWLLLLLPILGYYATILMGPVVQMRYIYPIIISAVFSAIYLLVQGVKNILYLPEEYATIYKDNLG